MNELNKLYKAMLGAFGAVVKPNHHIFMVAGGAEYEVKVDNMPLCLPVSELLNSSDSMEKVFFHPACENVTSKETEVFKIIRRMAGMRMLELFKKYPVILQNIAKGQEKRSWNQHTLDLLEPYKGVKKTVMDEVNNFMNRLQVEVGEDGVDNRFIHLKVSKGTGRSNTGSGERVYHRTKPVFPMYNEVVKRLAQSEGQSDNQSVELHSHSISRAALKLIAHTHRAILPAVMDPDNYESESVSAIASRLVSFLGCFEVIAEQFNRVQNTFRTEFDKLGIHSIDLSWTENLDTLPDIYTQIPAMDYNTHNTQEEKIVQQTSNMNGMFSVTSNNVVTSQNNNNQQTNGNGVPSNLLQEKDGYVLVPPTMDASDQWQRVEIAYHQNQVIHHAINRYTGTPVTYVCTRQGALLGRYEQAQMQNNNGLFGNNNINGVLVNALLGGVGGNNLTPIQQLMLLQGANNNTPASSSGSVNSAPVVDYGNSGLFNSSTW